MSGRIIPVLLIKNKGLVKTTGFKNPVYVGDPLNTIKIFNSKKADEIIVLDIIVTPKKGKPDFTYLSLLASECFMPMIYGGGICTLDDASKVFDCGVEKVSVNTAVYNNFSLISRIANKYGSQSVIVSIDTRITKQGNYFVFTRNGKENTNIEPRQYALMAQENGAGEILLTSINREGTRSGYDVALINMIASFVKIPLIACGGAKDTDDLKNAMNNGASAAAAGTMFFFTGNHRAVLISYPQNHSF